MIDRIMYFLLILFALASNISTGVTSFVIAWGIILSLIKLIIQKEKIVFDKNLFKMIILFSIIEIIVGVFGIHPIEGLKQAFSEIYRFSPLFFTTLFIYMPRPFRNRKSVFQNRTLFLNLAPLLRRNWKQARFIP